MELLKVAQILYVTLTFCSLFALFFGVIYELNNNIEFKEMISCKKEPVEPYNPFTEFKWVENKTYNKTAEYCEELHQTIVKAEKISWNVLVPLLFLLMILQNWNYIKEFIENNKY
jgi:hypothetical protein